ncbi:MAG: GNAT family N-acetyltransferase [Solirubrobacteraceae bacterium]
MLEPLRPQHRDGLLAAAQPAEIWDWLPSLAGQDSFDGWLAQSLELQASGAVGAFATLSRENGAVLGSTRYMNLRPEHRGLEIGWTWLTPSAWRTGANVEAKLLMLRHAFATLDCVRVEFKTDARNKRSRAALSALPAKYEGTLRRHMDMPGIGVRDSAYYSVIAEEWPDVEASLAVRLERTALERAASLQRLP